MIHSNMESVVQVVFFKNDEYYVAHCPALGLSVNGSSMHFALHHFEESINIIHNDLSKKGILVTRLLELGWTIGSAPEHLLLPPYFRAHQKLIEKCPEEKSDFLTCIDVKIRIPCSVNSLFRKNLSRSLFDFSSIDGFGPNGNRYPFHLN